MLLLTNSIFIILYHSLLLYYYVVYPENKTYLLLQLLVNFAWEQFDYPSYSPDMALGDFHIFYIYLHIK